MYLYCGYMCIFLKNMVKAYYFYILELHPEPELGSVQQADFYHLAEPRLCSQDHHQYFWMSAEQMDELLALAGF